MNLQETDVVPFWSEDDSFVPKPFEPTLAKKLKMLLDQYMSAGWALIYEHFHRKGLCSSVF